MKCSVVFEGVRKIDPGTGVDTVGDLIIREGVIQPEGADTRGLPCIRSEGLIVVPGFWDVHVHFRDPGNAAAETRLSGAAAAAAGGFTHVVTMPNTSPAGDSSEWIREQIEDTRPLARILPAACATRGRQGGELADIAELARAGAVAFTDDGSMVADDALMAKAMILAKAAGRPILDHAVVPSIAGRGLIRDCPLARRLHLPIFPPEAEVSAVERDIRLCEETGCATHIQHVSCAASVEAIRRARARGLPVTGEATPHHLALAAEDIPADDGNYRMNPPLGNRRDVEAIRAGVMDGALTLFATDHAPHTVEAKSHGFLKAPFGVIGLETAVGVTWKVMVEECGMPVSRWVAAWTSGPAALLGCAAPTLMPGAAADVMLLDTQTPWRVRPEAFRSLSRNTPFAGWTLHARAVMTVCEGRVTHRMNVLEPAPGGTKEGE